MIADLDPHTCLFQWLSLGESWQLRHFVQPTGPGHHSLGPPLVGMNMCHYTKITVCVSLCVCVCVCMCVRVCVCACACACACVRVCESGRSPQASWPTCKNLGFSAKLNWSDTGSLTTALDQAFHKHVGQNGDQQTYSPVATRRQWKSGGGIWDCPWVLCRDKQFCAGHLLHGVLSSEAAK